MVHFDRRQYQYRRKQGRRRRVPKEKTFQNNLYDGGLAVGKDKQMKYLYWIILLAAFAACSLFKNSSRNKSTELTRASSNSSVKATLKTTAKFNAGSALSIKDSLENAFYMQIWPKGVFTFSPALGFKGEAEKIVFAGKLKQRTATMKKDSLSAQHTSTQKIIAENKVAHSTKTNDTNIQKSVSWKIVAGFLVLVVALGGLLFKFLLKRKSDSL
jgi:hypothetical protein